MQDELEGETLVQLPLLQWRQHDTVPIRHITLRLEDSRQESPSHFGGARMKWFLHFPNLLHPLNFLRLKWHSHT